MEQVSLALVMEALAALSGLCLLFANVWVRCTIELQMQMPLEETVAEGVSVVSDNLMNVTNCFALLFNHADGGSYVSYCS